MKKKALIRFIIGSVFLAFVSFGCSQQMNTTTADVKPVQAKEEKNTYKGPVVGRSNKAKTISITVGKGDKAKTMMVKFDDDTEGLDYAKKGEAAIIKWEQRGDDQYAVVVKPKLAKLPEGVSEIKVEELHKLLQDYVPLTLIDSRPELRYNQGHLPGSLSVPVPKLKEMKAKVLPEDKNKLLVFYCGGYT
jgi:hypothetical protein